MNNGWPESEILQPDSKPHPQDPYRVHMRIDRTHHIIGN